MALFGIQEAVGGSGFDKEKCKGCAAGEEGSEGMAGTGGGGEVLRRAYRESGLVLERAQAAKIQGIMNSACRRCGQGIGSLDRGTMKAKKGSAGGEAVQILSKRLYLSPYRMLGYRYGQC